MPLLVPLLVARPITTARSMTFDQFAEVFGPVVACECGQGFIRYPAYAPLGVSGKAMDELLISSRITVPPIRVLADNYLPLNLSCHSSLREPCETSGLNFPKVPN